MSKTTFLFFLSVLFLLSCKIQAVNSQTINIKDFGAKGNGLANDQRAFEKVSDYINRKKGNITLVIPSGTYLVGKQFRDVSGKNYLVGKNVMELINCKNVEIRGGSNTKIRYRDNLKYGAFNPRNGQQYKPKMPFTDRRYTAQIGSCILLQKCNNVKISNIEVDGNNLNLMIGGNWGDLGIQLSHYGAQVVLSKNISFDKCNFHHLALDGIKVANTGLSADNIVLKNSKFNYNGRQGLSWIGGNGLKALNCEFSHTGKGGVSSSPAAGIDVEASQGYVVKNGSFINCRMINNNGCGMVADTGPSSDVSFSGSTFWGTTNWSIWVRKPNFTFTDCNIYGSFVHGYITSNFREATKFYSCRFEDKFYQGKRPYGGFLLECDKQKLMVFDKCTFTSTVKKTIWYNGRSVDPSGKAQFINCTFNVKNDNLNKGDYFGIIRRAKLEGVQFNYYFPKEKKYYLGQKNNDSKGVKGLYKNR